MVEVSLLCACFQNIKKVSVFSGYVSCIAKNNVNLQMINFTEITIIQSHFFYVNIFYFRLKHKMVRCNFPRSNIVYYYSVTFFTEPSFPVVIGPTIHQPNLVLYAYSLPLPLEIMSIWFQCFCTVCTDATSILSIWVIPLEIAGFKYSHHFLTVCKIQRSSNT